MTKSNDFLICDGCCRKIRVGDNTIGFSLHEGPVLIHKNIECLLKLDGVDEAEISSIGVPSNHVESDDQ